jgi:hypothetical protein
MKSYWLIAAAIVFAVVVGALTPLPRDQVARAPKTTADPHVVRLDPDNAYEWSAPTGGDDRKF